MRYIDADELIEFFDSYPDHIEFDVEDIKSIINEQDTADVVPMDFHDRCMEIEIQKRRNMVEVVRCKDCKHRKKNTFCLHNMRYENDNGFCSYGEGADA